MEHGLLKDLHDTTRLALDVFGGGAQINKCIEELQELIAELLEIDDNPLDEEHAARCIDETADVLIMAMQMRMLFGAAKVDERIRFKLQRLRERIESGRLVKL